MGQCPRPSCNVPSIQLHRHYTLTRIETFTSPRLASLNHSFHLALLHLASHDPITRPLHFTFTLPHSASVFKLPPLNQSPKRLNSTLGPASITSRISSRQEKEITKASKPSTPHTQTQTTSSTHSCSFTLLTHRLTSSLIRRGLSIVVLNWYVPFLPTSTALRNCILPSFPVFPECLHVRSTSGLPNSPDLTYARFPHFQPHMAGFCLPFLSFPSLLPFPQGTSCLQPSGPGRAFLP